MRLITSVRRKPAGIMRDMSSPADSPPGASPFKPNCLSIDLEVGVRSGRIRQLAAVRGDSGECLRCQDGDLAGALGRLDALAEGCRFLVGHNFLLFDRPHLAAAAPQLRLLALPVIDTLWLNPLAFPRHPYHHLVKHYHDGGLQRGQLNDPLLDAQLTLELFHDQYRALQQRQHEAPELLLAWHWLTTLDQRVSGLNIRENRCVDRRHLAAGRPDGRPGGRLAGTRHR